MLGVACVVFVALFAGIAFATATSGRIWRGSPGNSYNVCAEAVIRDTADNVAYIIAQDLGSGCWSDNNSRPSGWLGTKAIGLRDGGYCGTTGWYYNSSSTWMFGVGSHLCSNPGGVQEFYTKADTRAWNSSTTSYVDYLQITSPSQNY